MSPGGEKLRLREVFYHHRLFAPTAASEVTNVTRARRTSLPMEHVRLLSRWGRRQQRSYTPFGGQARALSSFAQTRVAGRSIQPITVFGIGLSIVTGGFAVGLVLNGSSFGPAWAVVVLGALSILAERRPVRVNSNVEITVSILPVVFAAVVFGPLSAMAVGALGLVVTFQQPYVRWLIWTCTRSLGAGLAGVAAAIVLVDHLSPGRLLAAVALAAFVNATFDAAARSPRDRDQTER